MSQWDAISAPFIDALFTPFPPVMAGQRLLRALGAGGGIRFARMAALFGFEDGPRMASTITAVTAELGVGPLLYRYNGADREEETFIACAYWRVEALARLGHHDEAEQLMQELDAIASPLGLLSEMCTPGVTCGELNGSDASAKRMPPFAGADT